MTDALASSERESEMPVEGRLGKPLPWVVLAAALLAAASFVVLRQMYKAEEDTQRRIVLERGQTVLNALAAGIRSQTQKGRYHPARLNSIFDELAQTPGIMGLQLADEHGTPVSIGGAVDKFPVLSPGVPRWEASRFALATETEFVGPPPWGDRGGPRSGHGRRSGGWGRFRDHSGTPADGEEQAAEPAPDRGRDGERPSHWAGHGPGGRGGGPGWAFPPEEEGMVDWGSGLHTLTVVLDTTEMEKALQRTQLQLGLGEAGVLAIIGLGVLVVLARLRHRQLRSELVVAREGAAYHEKLSRLGAGLAHETRNPLGVVRGLAQSIEQSEKAGVEAKRMASSIVDEADRTVGQINSFLSLARPKEPAPEPIELDTFFEEFLPLLQSEARGTGITVAYRGSGQTILADEDLLRRLLLNLTINALKACGGHGEVHIEAADGSLSVIDDGCGIAPEDLKFVKDPYFGRFEGGTGLGLSIVDQIARGHGWRLSIESELGEGTRVSLDGIHQVT